VEFLRELARTGKQVVTEVDDYVVARWLADMPDEVTLLTEAGPGTTLFSVDPVPSEPPPSPADGGGALGQQARCPREPAARGHVLAVVVDISR
jgi:hypothetical protein